MEDSMNHTTALGTTAAPPAPTRRVNDAPIRLFHALFALAFAGAWATGDSEAWRALHVTLGYTLAGLLGFRLLYGLVGPRPARLSMLWRRIAAAPAWWRASLRQLANPRAIGWTQGRHLLLSASIVGLLLGVVPLAFSGYAVYADWGGEWLEEVHEFFANALLALAGLHLAMLALSSALQRRHLARVMYDGRVAGAGADLVPSQRRGLAVLLLAAVLGFGTWQWQQSPAGLLPTAGKAERPQDHHESD
jgi:cytochrome b